MLKPILELVMHSLNFISKYIIIQLVVQVVFLVYWSNIIFSTQEKILVLQINKVFAIKVIEVELNYAGFGYLEWNMGTIMY